MPFVRLLACLIAGIWLQWQLQLQLLLLVIGNAVSLSLVIAYSSLPITLKYRIVHIGGIGISLFIFLFGSLLVRLNDISHNSSWFWLHYTSSDFVVATIEEPIVEKANSYKAVASLQYLVEDGSTKQVNGSIIIYFKKDSINSTLQYGTQVLFRRSLQEIRNSGNPGSFDFKRYCLFQGVTHQVYLADSDYRVVSKEKKNWVNNLIFKCNEWVINTLRKFIHGEKEQGLAEALLIGYNYDLDKSLVQSYSNTGVVHVIAISGLHLGLIYWLLLLLTKPLHKRKHLSWVRLMIILFALWWFSIMAGAQPSVLRSSVMFSFVALGEVIGRKGSVINTLALSAFVLLCYNPFWLWDVGFQLSYAAVLSILVFFKPINNWFYFENKLLDFVWKLNAVTISAQLLTLPVSVYHFHQLPTLFLFTNLVAVPLSSLILFAEILLCVLFFAKPAADILGQITHGMIWCMNSYIERWAGVSFSTWKDLSISGLQAVFMTVFIICFCCWLMDNKKSLLWVSLSCLLLFTGIRSVSFIMANRQQKLIVYNIPRHEAIDLIDGRNLHFIGDSEVLNNEYLKNFHILPARIENRVTKIYAGAARNFQFLGRHILIIDSSMKFLAKDNREVVDLLVLSKNPRFYISAFAKSFIAKQIVIDGSVPAWKSRLWKKDCDSLHIPCYVISEQGAFVMRL